MLKLIGRTTILPKKIKCVRPYNDLVQDQIYETTFKHKSPIDQEWYYQIPELSGAYLIDAFEEVGSI